MLSLEMLTIVNNRMAIEEMYPEDDDRVDSWDPANYADPIVDDPKWGCGIQPWSRGNPSAAEREWRAR